MKKSFRLYMTLWVFAVMILLSISCKKNSDAGPGTSGVPVINSFSPLTGSAGTVVTITGKNFSSTATNDLVSFNGVPAIVSSATVTQINVTVPNGATTGKISVKILTDIAVSTNDFNVVPLIHSFGTARSSMATAALHNKIYFGGGYDGTRAIGDVDIFDVDSAKWSLAQLSLPRFNFAAASAGHKILFGGGETDAVLPAPVSSVVDIYDDSTKTWSIAHLSSPSVYLSAGSAGNKILFGTGQVDTGVSYAVDIYDVVTNTWAKHLLNERKAYSNIIGSGNKIVIAGGLNAYGSTSNLDYYSRSVEIYNVDMDSWSQANLSVARGGMGAATTGNKIVFAGGFTKDTAYNIVLSSVVDIYDVSSGGWSTSQLPVASSYSCAAASGNQILFVRDSDSPGYDTGTVDVFDISTNSWSTSSLSESRIQIGTAGAANKIVFAGGWNGSNGFSKTVDIYTVTTGTWSH